MDSKIHKDGKRYEHRQKRPRIEVHTLPNGYDLKFDGMGNSEGYMYYSPDELLKGFMVHIGMHMTEQLNTDTIDDFIEAAIRWSDTKKSIEEIKRLKIEINKVIGRRNSMAMRLYKERQRFVDLVVATQKLAEETKNVKGISKQIATLVHDYKKTQPFTMKELGLAGPIEEYDDE
jgi:hypothetical protein